MTFRTPVEAADTDALPWSADNGDGTYRNPVLHADWSDPDVIGVRDDFYLVASSFHRVPGLPILHSRDLVNWTIINHALPRLEPEGVFSAPQHGCGIWAPAIRHHDDKFWIFYPDPDRGIFVVTADDPAGVWSRPRLIKGGNGLIDPCPLWDDDGSTYLVHGWAKSRAGFNNKLTCHQMDATATTLLDDGRIIVDGDALPGYQTLEGPKLYKRDGWYWIFAPAGGVATGWQSVFRSRHMHGPYEDRIVLSQGDTPINGPHQGAWVSTAAGQDWFMHFQDKGPFGRVTHLQPMNWQPEGWPAIGHPAGHPVLAHAKPVTAVASMATAPASSDTFAGRRLGAQWTWAANPDPAWWSINDGLRLACAPTDRTKDLRDLPNLLGQRLPTDDFRATATLRLADTAVAARAGLAVVGASYGWIGLEHTAEGMTLVYRMADAGEPERDGAEPVLIPGCSNRTSPWTTVGVDVHPDGRCQFFVVTDTGQVTKLGDPFLATPGRWVGATLGLFATTPLAVGCAGTADIRSLHITRRGQKQP